MIALIACLWYIAACSSGMAPCRPLNNVEHLFDNKADCIAKARQMNQQPKRDFLFVCESSR